MKMNIFSVCTLCLAVLLGCTSEKTRELEFVKVNVDYSAEQMQRLYAQAGNPDKHRYPRTSNKEGKLATTGLGDWTQGFYPGIMWYLYELTNDEEWKEKAEKWTASLKKDQFLTAHHDIGFVMYCSYGNAERLASKPEYRDILLQSAKSLCTRYNDTVQSIQSWPPRKSWDGKVWNFPVIIDNMMNLELLSYASRVSGDPFFKEVAVKHANTTLKNHFRPDFSSYHVVDYDRETGKVLHRQTCQGYSDNSTWSRGQAWAVYGFTMMYRETQKEEYLSAAQKLADYFIQHLPEDMVPMWDFNVGQEGYVPDGDSNAKAFIKNTAGPRDASAAAVVCSALFELGELSHNTVYTETAVKMLKNLASPSYRAPLGENAGFMMMHCTGSIPHKSEIDKPLVYADYYFIEALARYKRLLETGSVFYK